MKPETTLKSDNGTDLKRYKVDKDLIPYLRRVIIRSFEHCNFESEDGTWYCDTCVSSSKFHKMVMRARCEKETSETGVFVMTQSESDDSFYRQTLLDQAGETTYLIADSASMKA